MRVEGRRVRCAPLMLRLSPHAELNCLGCDRQLRNRTMCIEFSAQLLGRGALARSGFWEARVRPLRGHLLSGAGVFPHNTGRAGTGSSGRSTGCRRPRRPRHRRCPPARRRRQLPCSQLLPMALWRCANRPVGSFTYLSWLPLCRGPPPLHARTDRQGPRALRPPCRLGAVRRCWRRRGGQIAIASTADTSASAGALAPSALGFRKRKAIPVAAKLVSMTRGQILIAR
jgi:hypothetical protein